MKKISILWLVLIQWVLALEWLLSGWGKFTKPDFMAGIGKTLSTFAGKTTVGWYGGFLDNVVVPNASLFGNLVRCGEILVSLTLIIGGILAVRSDKLHPLASWALVIALYGAAFMNLNFYLAAGWSSPSTAGVNMVMGLAQLIIGTHYLTSVTRSLKTE